MVGLKMAERQHSLRIGCRLIIILVGFTFVIYGWCRTASKFVDSKTAVSITVTEKKMFRYPSFTICPGFKDEDNIWHHLMEKGYGKYDEILANISYSREDILTIFSHPSDTDFKGPGWHNDIVRNDSAWKETIPHQWLSGICYTYDPPFESRPAKWYGVRMGIKRPNPDRFALFLHERDQFHFFMEDDMPSAELVDFSYLR